MKKFKESGLWWLWLTVLVMAVDRISKVLALKYLTPYVPYKLLSVFNLTLAFNTGAAFSFLGSASGWQHYLFGGLALIVTGVLLVWLSRLARRDWLTAMSLSLIIAGALGNAWDRVQYGYVIDYFDFHLGSWHFAIFNVADSAISVGAALLILQWLFESRHGKKA